MKRARWMPVLCVAATMAATGCHRAEDRSPVVATVNGRDIHRDQFERFLALKMGEFTNANLSDELRSRMLDEYIRRGLLLEEAARAGLAVTAAEIDQVARQDPKLRSHAATPGARDEVAADLLVEKFYRQVLLRDVRVSSEEVQRYIEQNQARLTDRPGFYVREIRAQSREEAERLREQVTEGKRDFGSVARLHSEASNAEVGGLSRYDQGQLPAVLERAIEQLRPGDISPVIQSSFGFHIFKLERRIQPHAPDERRSQLDERRSQLAEELIARKNQQAIDEALDRLTSAAAIKIHDAALGFTYAGQLRHN